MAETQRQFECRTHSCHKPVREGNACCSRDCRNKVENCQMKDCNNATEPCIMKGIVCYSIFCHQHGGRIYFDESVQPPRKMKLYVKTIYAGWQQI